jgi:hypothetical protein
MTLGAAYRILEGLFTLVRGRCVLGSSPPHTDLVNPPSTRMFCPVM